MKIRRGNWSTIIGFEYWPYSSSLLIRKVRCLYCVYLVYSVQSRSEPCDHIKSHVEWAKRLVFLRRFGWIKHIPWWQLLVGSQPTTELFWTILSSTGLIESYDVSAGFNRSTKITRADAVCWLKNLIFGIPTRTHRSCKCIRYRWASCYHVSARHRAE
jgi:hypothetical protein